MISSIAKSRPKLSSFLKEICKEDLGDTGVELFGPEVQKKITQRASTIEAFNKAISKVDNPSSVPSSSSSFFIQAPGCKVRGRARQKLYPVQQFLSAQTGLQRQQGPLPTPKEVPKLQTQGLGSQDQPVGGILQSHLHAWCQITDNPWVLQCIQGYHLEFGEVLPPENWPCNLPRLTQEQSQILDQEIQNLLQKNAIESTVSTKGFFSSMFTVPKKDGGWRPIINLRSLNSYLVVSQFKMEGIGSLKDVLQEGDFMGKIDLEDAYLSVPVHQEHRDFLKFCWRRKIYRFRSLPFGLATAPRVFTKILRPLVARMRMTGLRIIVYLDDMLVMAQSAERLMSHMQTLARELQALGFKLNHKKCVWEPVQAIEFLGFLVNSKTMKIYLLEEKIQKVMKECRHTINKRSVTARHLAHLIGLLSLTAPVVSVAPLHYRGLQRLCQRALQISQGNYDYKILVDQEAEADLQSWESTCEDTTVTQLSTPRQTWY